MCLFEWVERQSVLSKVSSLSAKMALDQFFSQILSINHIHTGQRYRVNRECYISIVIFHYPDRLNSLVCTGVKVRISFFELIIEAENIVPTFSNVGPFTLSLIHINVGWDLQRTMKRQILEVYRKCLKIIHKNPQLSAYEITETVPTFRKVGQVFV